jgi:hypothetical protein
MRRRAGLMAATTMAVMSALVPATAGGAVPGAATAAVARTQRSAPGGWAGTVRFRQQVVSSPTRGGGYPGAEPAPGGCVRGRYDSNFSESALALRPRSEQLVGGAKAFFGRWSTFKSSHTVSFSLPGRGGPGQVGRRAGTHFVGGFDCATTGSQAMPPSWTNVTDPTLAWDNHGRIHQLVLAYNAYWGTVTQPNGNVYSVHSDDGGRTWRRDNGGRPVDTGPDLSVDSARYLDKPWITANQHRFGPRAGHLYGAWVLFTDGGAEIRTAVSRNRGRSWSRAVTVPTPQHLGPSNPWPMVAVGADGVVHLSYVSYGTKSADGSSVPVTLWSARSTDDGRTWTGFDRVADTTAVGSSTLPGTTLHRSIVQYLAASPDRPGHLYVAWNRLRHGQVDVMVSASHDNGRTWSHPRRVNDDRGTANQFSATVAAGPRGAVAVGFYDMRARCPRHDPAILAGHRGRRDTCIGLTLQPFRDTARGLRRTRPNLLVSRHLWDPYQPGGTRGGVSQQACEDASASCDDIFLGDYFSMQVSARRVYALSASTHPRSSVVGDGGRRLHYQQQVLTTVSRHRLGL